MALPSSSSGLPALVPQSLGGEYRVLPETDQPGRGVAFDLSNISDISKVEVFVNNVAAERGDTSGTLGTGGAPRFSTVQTAFGSRLSLLLPLTTSDPRTPVNIGIDGAPGGWQSLVVLDTPSHSIATRPEASDELLFPDVTQYYWWQPIYAGGRDPKYVVGRDVLVAGWLMPGDNNTWVAQGPFDPTGTTGTQAPLAASRNCTTGTTTAAPSPRGYCEDIHYYLLLDPSFLAQVYGRSDRTTSLTVAALPGNSAYGQTWPSHLAERLTASGQLALTINSFQIHNGTCGSTLPQIPGGYSGDLANTPSPWNTLSCLKGEQPIWHQTTTPPTSLTYFGKHMNGLGPVPTGWERIPTEPTFDPETFYPFNPETGIEKLTRLDATDGLRAGDYIIAKATLWQDSPHGYLPPSCFPYGSYDDGWLEFHVIDWIAKVPAPKRVTTSAQISTCIYSDAHPLDFDEEVSPPPDWFTARGATDTLHSCLLVDERFTTLPNVSGLQSLPGSQPNTVRVKFRLQTGVIQNGVFTNSNASFMASVVMWWASASDQSLDPACFGLSTS